MDGRSIAGVVAIGLGGPMGVVGAIYLPSNSDEPHSYVLIALGLAFILGGIFLLRGRRQSPQ
jgi:LPXTG-motif cell wall-anchored protein